MQREEADQLCRERLNVLPDWILETDTQGVITYSNRVVEDLLGWLPEEIIGLRVNDLAAAPDEGKCRECLEKALAGQVGRSNSIVHFAHAVEGTRALALCCVAVTPGLPMQQGLRIVARDVSDVEAMHRAAHETAENYRSVLENSPTGIVIVQNERLVYANPTIFAMLGYSREDAGDGSVWRFVHPDDLQFAKLMYSRRIAGEHPPDQYEIRAIAKSGEVRHFELRATLITYNGAPAVLDSVIDITERKRAELALAQAQAKYRILVEESLVGIHMIKDGRFVYVNPRTVEILGYSEEELLGMPSVLETVFPEDRPRAAAELNEALEASAESTHSLRVVRKDGSVANVEIHTLPVEFQDEHAVLAFMLDVSDRVAAESEVRRLVQLEDVITRLSTEFINMPSDRIDSTVVRALGVIGDFIQADRGFVFQISENRKTVTNTHEWCAEGVPSNKADYQLLRIDDFPSMKKRLANGAAVQLTRVGDMSDEYAAARQLLEAEDVRSFVALPMMSDGQPIGFLGFETVRRETSWNQDTVTLLRILGEVFVNALARKRSDDALRAQTDFAQRVLNSAEDHMAVVDAEGKILQVNEAWRKFAIENDAGEDELQWGVGANYYDAFRQGSEDDPVARQALEGMRQVQQGLLPSFELEYPCNSPDQERWFLMRVLPLIGRPGVVIVSHIDLTEQKRTQNALIRSENLLSRSFDAIQDGISVLDSKLHIVRVNAKMEEWYSHMLPFIGKKCFEVYHKRDRPCDVCPTKKAMHSKTPAMEIIPLEGPEGIVGWHELYSYPILDADGECTGVVEYVRDISDRVRDEERLTNLTKTLVSFGPDPLENINQLMGLLGQMMHATSAMYNRLADGKLYAWGRWNMPADYPAVDEARGHICYDMITEGAAEPLVLRNLEATPFAESCPVVKTFGLQTYIGHPVRLDNVVVGSVCVLYRRDYEPSDDDLRFLSVVASAIGVEERRKASEDALRESEERYRLLFDSSPDVVFMLRDSLIVEVSASVKTVLGYEPEEVVGKSPWFLSPEYQPDGTPSKRKAEMYISQAIDQGPQMFDWIHQTKDGASLDCSVSLVAFPYKGQVHVQAIVRNITERKRAEEHRRNLERGLEAQKRHFYRDTILSVTDGKLDICEPPELRPYIRTAKVKIDVTQAADVGPARKVVDEFCREHGLKGERLDTFMIGVGEAITNAIKHAGRGRVYAGVRDGSVWVAVADKGPGIGSLILPRATLLRGFSTKPSLGLGYTIMLEVSDHILLKTGDTGTTVLLMRGLVEPQIEWVPEALPDTWDTVPS
jgi:PAS domain S-box-containing protein